MKSARIAAVSALLVAAAVMALGCRGSDAPVIAIEAPLGSGIDLSRASWFPPEAVVRADLVTPRRLELAVREGLHLTLSAPGACPTTVEAAAPRVTLRSWLDVSSPPPFVGHAAPFEIRVRTACGDVAPTISWRQVGGPRVPFSVKEGGTVLSGRTPARPEGAAEWGILPLSHHASAPLVFEVKARRGDDEVARTVRVAAAPRASGLPSLSVGQTIALGGDGWVVRSAPLDSGAVVHEVGGSPAFAPDVPGRYVLADASGRELALSAGRHDAMPLDCGRSECHEQATAAARHGPMTTTLVRGIRGELGSSFDPRCAVECHATGEPALDDGFVAVAAALGIEIPEGPRGVEGWDALPPALRRLGGVGCTACHGPSSLPEPSARWRIIRAEVCAVCHDAPPRYGHVVAWRSSRMAVSDADDRTRAPGCAKCHTTLGFLDWIGVRRLGEEGVVERAGIACAACHAPHGDAVSAALVRRVPPPASAETLDALPGFGPDAPARVCLGCHSPSRDDVLPAASAAELVTAEASPHAAIEGGCLGCHSAGPSTPILERGGGHAFRADPARCARCHEGAAPAERPDASGRLVRDRARELWALIVKKKLARTSDPNAPHASVELMVDPASEEAAAIRDVLLVLEDPAAGVHGARHARALLDGATKKLGPKD